LLWQGKVTGRMVGSLLLRSLERSEHIYQAMLARGYDGQLRTLSYPRMRRQDYLVLLISATLLFSVVFAARFLY
jgi:cobalt/nickel transport system permease protein